MKQMLRIMKLTTFLLFVMFFQVSAGAFSQNNGLLNLKAEKESVNNILKLIEESSEFRFLYNSSNIDVERKTDIDCNSKNIEEVLDILFRGTNVKYRSFNSNYVLFTEDKDFTEFVQQQKSVSGKVTDFSGGSIPGVSVVVKGTTKGTITDSNGSYTLSSIPGDAILQFSFMGMKSYEVKVGSMTSINVVLQEETIGIEEVVAIGYGIQKKVTSTGSIVSTSGDQLKQSPTTNLTSNLIGRLSGLTAITTSSEPGNDGAILRIRGSNTLGDNSPLVIVDGIANRALGSIEPADIENITVLKDASAAIYGSQAANGVILITTRRGLTGKPKITIGMDAGFNQPTRIPKMSNAAQYATMLNENAYYNNPVGGRNQTFTATDIQKFADGSDPWGHPNTDWFKEVLKTWSNQNHQTFSISGGTADLKYFLSLGARYEDGFYKNSANNYKQYDFRSNIDGKINKYINIGFNLAGREELRNNLVRPGVDNPSSVWRSLLHSKPTMPAFWPDGTPGPDIEQGDNPAITTTSVTGTNLNKTYVLESNLSATISIPWVKGLSITGNASFDKTFEFDKKFAKPWYLYTWDGNANHITTPGKRGYDTPQLSENMSDGQKITLNAFVTYEKTFAEKHNIKVMAGTERRSGKSDIFSAFRKNYISSAIDQLFAGAADQYMSNDGSAREYAYLSYFGRVNYDLSKKYLIEFVWREDGSYKFPQNKRFGFFPGVSAGWRISEENFWKNNLTFFDDFKIRGSWGQTGNDRIAEYQYLASYAFLQDREYVFGTTDSKIAVETKVPNPNVTWEVANQVNIGFDALLLKNKVSFSADYFDNLRTQILIRRNASIPSSAGFTLPPENIGKVRNSGFEGVISYHNKSGVLNYDLSINGSYSKNKIVFWDETPGVPVYQQSTGRPIGSTLYYQAIGIFKDQAAVDAYPHWAGARPGDIIFKDVNKDGLINGLDRVMDEKNSMPRFVGGFMLNLKYKQFDMSTLIQGASGAQQYVVSESGDVGNYYKDFADNRWTPENTNAAYPRSYNRANQYWIGQANTFWLRSTNYVRLKNFELGYSLPLTVNKALGVDHFRVYVNGLNLFTIDKCKVIDPEVASGDGQSYPLQRVVNIGLTLTF